jgi:GNAT superfamily N-acetyltransferase
MSMGSVRVERVGWDDAAAVTLREAMAAEMLARYADRFHTRQAIEADTVVYTGVAYSADGRPVGHAALRRLGADLELKRMYVVPSERGRGVAVALLAAADLGAPRLVLQTGDRQPDAVRLYEKSGYTRIPIYPPYERQTYSNCFQKLLPA